MPNYLNATALLVGALACGCTAPADSLRPRAAHDLQCPADQLVFTPIGGDCGKKAGNTYDCTLGVRGCDQQATYIHVKGSDAWVMDTARTPNK